MKQPTKAAKSAAPPEVWAEIDKDLDAYIDGLKKAIIEHVTQYEKTSKSQS